MKIRIYLDGEFNGEEHSELNELGDIFIDWKLNTIPIKGDYLRLDYYYDKLPSFANESDWLVEHRTFESNDIICLYLMYYA